jgi:hypothetical protein
MKQKVKPFKMPQDQYDWQKKAALMDQQDCKLYESEDLLQADCVAWFKWYLHSEALLASTPNGGQRNQVEAMKLVATGVFAGFADLTLMMPGRKIWFLECKNRKDFIDPNQVVFKEKVEAFGFQYFMFNTFNQFRCLVQYLLEIPEEKFLTLK